MSNEALVYGVGWVAIITIFIIFGTFAIGGILAAPWVPLWKNDIRRMLRLAGLKEGEVLYDLGAGDGRILKIAAGEFAANAWGFEIAVLPYLLGYCTIGLRGLRAKAHLRYGNFFNHSFEPADVITTFLTPQAMAKLKSKLATETKPGCRIISYAFAIPGWPPTKIDKPNQTSTVIYLYQR